MRLTPTGYEIGLASEERYRLMLSKREQRDCLIEWAGQFLVKSTPEINERLVAEGTSPMTASLRLIELLKRPQLNFRKLSEWLPAIRSRIGRIEELFLL